MGMGDDLAPKRETLRTPRHGASVTADEVANDIVDAATSHEHRLPSPTLGRGGPKSVEWCESPKDVVTYSVKRSTITVMSSCCGAPAANAWAP